MLVEGGGELHAAFLRAGLVNRVCLYVAPILLGGQETKSLLGGRSPRSLADTVPVTNLHFESLGNDVLITGDV